MAPDGFETVGSNFLLSAVPLVWMWSRDTRRLRETDMSGETCVPAGFEREACRLASD